MGIKQGLGKFLQNRYNKKKAKAVQKQQQKLFILFKKLYGFFQMIDKSLKNRSEKKKFWKGFIKNGDFKKVFTNAVNYANPHKGTYWVDRNDLRLDKLKLAKALEKVEEDKLKKDVVIEILSKVKITDIIEIKQYDRG